MELYRGKSKQVRNGEPASFIEDGQKCDGRGAEEGSYGDGG